MQQTCRQCGNTFSPGAAGIEGQPICRKCSTLRRRNSASNQNFQPANYAINTNQSTSRLETRPSIADSSILISSHIYSQIFRFIGNFFHDVGALAQLNRGFRDMTYRAIGSSKEPLSPREALRLSLEKRIKQNLNIVGNLFSEQMIARDLEMRLRNLVIGSFSCIGFDRQGIVDNLIAHLVSLREDYGDHNIENVNSNPYYLIWNNNNRIQERINIHWQEQDFNFDLRTLERSWREVIWAMGSFIDTRSPANRHMRPIYPVSDRLCGSHTRFFPYVIVALFVIFGILATIYPPSSLFLLIPTGLTLAFLVAHYIFNRENSNIRNTRRERAQQYRLTLTRGELEFELSLISTFVIIFEAIRRENSSDNSQPRPRL